MKKIAICCVALVSLASCGTFNSAHYRHVNKVPAHSFYVENSVMKEEVTPIVIREECVARLPECDTVACVTKSDSVSSNVVAVSEKLDSKIAIKSLIPPQKKQLSLRTNKRENLRRDWSLAVAALLLVAGLLLLMYMIGILFVTPILLIVRIALSLLFGTLGLKALIEGVSIVMNRFRSRKNFKES